jgi:transcriptional regulator with XRE-family HTH domain
MTVGKRIKAKREALRISQTELGQALEPPVTRNAVSMWERNKSQPTADRLRQLSLILKVDYDWLATARNSPTSATGLPFRGVVEGGAWREVPDSQDIHDVKYVPVAPDSRFPVDAQYVLEVSGNSVNKVAANGTMVHCIDIVAGGIELRDRDLVVVERTQGHLLETTVKRLRKGTNGLELHPESDDPAHQMPLAVSESDGDVTIKALVIFVISPVSRT